MKLPLLLLPVLSLPALSGCTRAGASAGVTPDNRAEIAEVREELQQIPTPSKSRYLPIKSLDAWQNPYLTIQGGMVTVHVLIADANASDLGVGGILRPVGARRQDLNVRTADLPAAINAIPQNAWPYGRVVALEEAHNTPPSAQPQVRRNLEAAIKILGDIGVVGYEWQDGGPALR